MHGHQRSEKSVKEIKSMLAEVIELESTAADEKITGREVLVSSTMLAAAEEVEVEDG